MPLIRSFGLSPSSSQELPRSLEPWWGSIAAIWLLAAPLCMAVFSLLLPISPNDFWYHVRAGWLGAASGNIPTANLLAWGVPAQTPYLYQSWLAERILYHTTVAGLVWVVVLRSACLALALGLLVAAVYRRLLRTRCSSVTSARCAAVSGLFTIVLISNNLDIRPQTFSVVLFALWTFGLAEWPFASSGCRTWMHLAALGTFVLWCNLHGAFIMGLVLVGLTAAVSLAHDAWGRKIAPALRLDPSLAFVAITVLLVSGLNPDGYKIFSYLSLLGRLPADRYIEEWRPPGFDEWHSALFLLSPGLIVLLLAVGRAVSWRVRGAGRRCTLPAAAAYAEVAEWLALTCLFLLALKSQRAILWYALWLPLVLGPLFARCAAATKPSPASPEPVVAPARAAQLANLVLLVLLSVSWVPLLPWFKPAWPWPAAYRARFARTPRLGTQGFPSDPDLLLDTQTPVRACLFLEQSPPRRRLFCDMVMGSYVDWALYPRTRAFVDPRVELYPFSLWQRYASVSRGEPGTMDWLAHEDCSDALLDTEGEPALIRALAKSHQWHLVFSAGRARVFRIEEPVASAWEKIPNNGQNGAR